MKPKNIIIALVALIVVGIGIVALASGNSKTSTPKNNAPAQQAKNPDSASPKTASALIIGNQSAKTTIVEYADFQCPKCNKFFKGAEQDIIRDYVKTGKANIEYRTFITIGPETKVPAAGAYCANDQGKFSGYHDAVFNYMYDNYYGVGKSGENVGALSSDNVKEIAGSAGLDQSAFDSCLDSGKYNPLVESVIKDAGSTSSTPTVLINNQKIEGVQPFSVYKTLLDAQG